MEKEIWKSILGYEGIYEISNYGNVRRISYDHYQNQKEFSIPFYKKPAKDKDGYLRYSLAKNNKDKSYFAHRLVAQAFIPNPNNYPIINHIDCNPQNNYYKNLEWCNHKYNTEYALRLKRLIPRKASTHYASKYVYQYDKDGNFLNVFNGSCDAARKLNILSGHIRECCRGVLKTYKGFIFRYGDKINQTSTTIKSISEKLENK